jgi:hypothetical protein
MSIPTPKQLNTGNTVPGTSVGTIYTVPASTNTAVQTITMCNTTSADATITLYRVPSGGTAGAANMVLNVYKVTAGNTIILDNLRWVLPTGATLQALQGTASAITIYVDGVEMV